MVEQNESLQALREIRHIMGRSERFQSLSGLSGIFVGGSALVGAGAIRWYLAMHQLSYSDLYTLDLAAETTRFVAVVLAVVFILAASWTSYFTTLKARKAQQTVWTNQSRRLLVNFSLPLAIGGVFCGILLFHSLGYLVVPAMLLFYGMALFSASKFTFSDLRSLGLFEVVLGLLSGFWVEYGLLAWVLGFGVLHVVYGGILYFKYEKSTAAVGF